MNWCLSGIFLLGWKLHLDLRYRPPPGQRTLGECVNSSTETVFSFYLLTVHSPFWRGYSPSFAEILDSDSEHGEGWRLGSMQRKTQSAMLEDFQHLPGSIPKVPLKFHSFNQHLFSISYRSSFVLTTRDMISMNYIPIAYRLCYSLHSALWVVLAGATCKGLIACSSFHSLSAPPTPK